MFDVYHRSRAWRARSARRASGTGRRRRARGSASSSGRACSTPSARRSTGGPCTGSCMENRSASHPCSTSTRTTVGGTAGSARGARAKRGPGRGRRSFRPTTSPRDVEELVGETASMAGVEAFRDPLEEEVVEKALAPKTDERLGEIEVPLFPSLPEPRVPACLQSDFHHLGADRALKGLVFREVAGGVEGDEEPTGRIDAEEDRGSLPSTWSSSHRDRTSVSQTKSRRGLPAASDEGDRRFDIRRRVSSSGKKGSSLPRECRCPTAILVAVMKVPAPQRIPGVDRRGVAA